MLRAAAMMCRSARFPILVAAALTGCVKPPAPQAAAPVTLVAPTPVPPAEKLAWPMRTGNITWQEAADGTLPGGGGMAEYVPAGETIADWTEMVTAMTLPPEQDPSSRLTAILTALKGACRSYRVVQSGAADVLVRCDDPDEAAFSDPNILLHRHEVLWAKTIHGKSGNYVIWRTWHGDAITPGSILASGATRQEWQDWVDQVSLAGG